MNRLWRQAERTWDQAVAAETDWNQTKSAFEFFTPEGRLNERVQLQAAISAIDVELANGVPGGRLLAESLANVTAVHLIRHATGNARAVGRSRGGLPGNKLRAAVEYIEEHLDSEVPLDELAAVAHLSPYHFSRLFKTSTGLPPHQYVITRRIECAKRWLRDDELPLAQVATRVGFWDQGHFTRHFKRLVGVTPKRFR